MTFVALAQSHFLNFMTQQNGWLSCHTKVEDEYGPHWGRGESSGGGGAGWCGAVVATEACGTLQKVAGRWSGCILAQVHEIKLWAWSCRVP